VALMLLDNAKADKMQSAVDSGFARLPVALRTEEVRDEIAKVVVRSSGDYKAVAHHFVTAMIASVEYAMAKLESFRSR
jgi:hypothetical protein